MTIQVSEFLLYKGEEVELETNPLRAYLKSLKVNPIGKGSMSWCWRGYQGTWEIREQELYLTELIIQSKDDKELGVASLFPGKDEVFADWYTGELEIQFGEVLEHTDSIFLLEKSVILTIKNGFLVDEKIIDNKDKIVEKLVNEVFSKPVKQNVWTRFKEFFKNR